MATQSYTKEECWTSFRGRDPVCVHIMNWDNGLITAGIDSDHTGPGPFLRWCQKQWPHKACSLRPKLWAGECNHVVEVR